MQLNKLVIASIFVVLFFGVLELSAQELPKLSGITVEDTHPNGCVDCHAQNGDKDYRLITGLKYIKDHPDINVKVKIVPKDCLECHKSKEEGGPLNLITHKAHYQNPQENNYIKFYQGDCLGCHSIDAATVKVSMKNGPKNW